MFTLLTCDTIYPSVSPLILLANCMSLGIIVTHLACIVHRFISSNSHIKCNSAASCRVKTAPIWMLYQGDACCNNSLTTLRNAILEINSSVDLWNFWISHNASVPSWYLLAFLFIDFSTWVVFLPGWSWGSWGIVLILVFISSWGWGGWGWS